MIQEHHASSLHWDLRLERDGVLVSWAVPKGLPSTPDVDHLAVHTEDHPLDYALFEGEIPAGEYGAGQMSIWDHGRYECEKWEAREVKVVLHGERTDGRFVLFPTKGKNWMIHRMDATPPGWQALPERLEPMLAVPGALPKGREWAYEFKWDGIRALVRIDGGRAAAWSRSGNDLTSAFPELRQLGGSVGMHQMLLDGELVTFDEAGRPSFGLLQRRMHRSNGRRLDGVARQLPASYVIFDLLHVDGESLLPVPYDERRRRLEVLDLNGERWATTPAFTDIDGSKAARVARERGLEGLVAKRRTSPYRPGRRSDEWVKVKDVRTQEVVVVGWTTGQGQRRATFGALLLAVPTPDGLEYVGRVGTGFTEAERQVVLGRLRPLARKTPPVRTGLPASVTGTAHWVRPITVAEVRFSEWTRDRHLRQPSWRGLRADKRPEDVVREP